MNECCVYLQSDFWLLPAYQSFRTKHTEWLNTLQMKVSAHSWELSLWNTKGIDLLLYMFVVSSLSDSTVHSFFHCTEGVQILFLIKSKPLMEVAERSTKHHIWLTEYTGFLCLSSASTFFNVQTFFGLGFERNYKFFHYFLIIFLIIQLENCCFILYSKTSVISSPL